MSYSSPKKPCPPATHDIALNLKNRKRAIQMAAYGPANPALRNTEFWKSKADVFGGSVAEAKTMRCGNCAAFNVSPRVQRCISDGIGYEGIDPYDMIDAGELGYCEAFKFKCASARTCDAWIVGGPIRRERS